MMSDLGDDATIERIGTPEKVISAFGPEVIGENVEGKVLSMEVSEHDGRKYYQFELEPPHALITATAAGNRLYLFNVTGSGMNIFSCSHQLIQIISHREMGKSFINEFDLDVYRSTMEEALQGFEEDSRLFPRCLIADVVSETVVAQHQQ